MDFSKLPSPLDWEFAPHTWIRIGADIRAALAR